MAPVNLDIASAKKDGKEAFALLGFVTQDALHMECARTEPAFALMVCILSAFLQLNAISNHKSIPSFQLSTT